MNTSASQPRQPHGIPAGGQFAATAHSDDDITLGEQHRSPQVVGAGDQPPIVPEPTPEKMPLIAGLGELPRDARAELDTHVRESIAADTDGLDRWDQEGQEHRAELTAEQILNHLPRERFTERWGDIVRTTHVHGYDSPEATNARARAATENQAWRDAKGIDVVDENYTPPAQRQVDGYGPNATQGERYTDYSNVSDVAKDVRQEIKAAKSAGYLPADLEYRVTTDKFAGGQSLTVTVCGLADSQIHQEDDWGRQARSDEATELTNRVSGIANAWNRRDVDTMSDYFNVTYYDRVELETEPTRRWRESVAAERKAKREAKRSNSSQA